MRAVTKVKDNWIIMALGVYLATLTNHSHGEVVYRKFSTIEALAQSDQEEAPQASMQASSSGESLKVRKVTSAEAGLTVLLNGGKNQGYLPGTVLEARRLRKGTWIPTALLKIIEVQDSYCLAQVTADGSQVSLMHFPDFPGIMVGDEAFAQELVVAQTLRILPTRTLTFDRLFVDPKGMPSSFELTPEGKNRLLDEARVFVDAHVPLLIIEGHTDLKGGREANQIESYQRALTIRQILIEELDLDPERLVAIGLGESEPLDEPYLPGRDRETRRIVLRAKNSKTSP